MGGYTEKKVAEHVGPVERAVLDADSRGLMGHAPIARLDLLLKLELLRALWTIRYDLDSVAASLVALRKDR